MLLSLEIYHFVALLWNFNFTIMYSYYIFERGNLHVGF